MEQQQQEGIYRGIKLADSVKLYKKDGSFYKKTKKGLDSFLDLLEEKSHEVLSKYVKIMDKMLIDFKCGHKPH
ncbi:hypothetical protein NDK43_19410 [Neobacillus pocheonensis]|uniref:Transposase n=1 Tax=Neobacillus pocheonensis TaxID=363869 RepID=A0ABT0WCZ9_9BACI|nr:hypothetical protein [Neobacillus pocheonensis]